jgi:hypothetical protein
MWFDADRDLLYAALGALTASDCGQWTHARRDSSTG